MLNKKTNHEKEFQKCKDSPVYFYNKYVRKEGQKELTKAEYKDIQDTPLKLRRCCENKPSTYDQCHKNLPDFFIKQIKKLYKCQKIKN